MSDQVDDALRRARALRGSSGRTHIQETWEDLRRSHQFARQHNDELPEFPYWVVEQVPHPSITLMLQVNYGKGYHDLETQGSVVFRSFQVDHWRVILFFGNLGQILTKAMTPIAHHLAGSVSFDNFYRQVRHIRDRRLINLRFQPSSSTNARGFEPRDFRTYLNYVRHWLDHELEGGSDSDFEPDRGSSHRRGRRFSHRVTARAQTQARTQPRTRDCIRASGQVVRDVFTVASESDSINSGRNGDNGEWASDGDFGYPDTNNEVTNTESTRSGDDSVVVQGDHEDISDHVSASTAASGHPGSSSERGNKVDEETVTNVSLANPSTLSRSASLMEAGTRHGPEGNDGASSSGTRQASGDQVGQEAQPRPAQTRTALPIESAPTSDTVDIAPDTASGEARDSEQNHGCCESFSRFITAKEASYTAAKESFEAAHTSWTSLHTKAVALEQEEQAALDREEQLGKRLNVILGKRDRNTKNLEAIGAKRAKLDAEMTKIMAAPADAFYNLPSQLGVTRLPPDE